MITCDNVKLNQLLGFGVLSLLNYSVMPRSAGMDVDSISVGKVEAPEKALWVGLLGSDQDEVGK